MGYTEMIKLCPDKTLAYIQPIERNGQRLFKLVQDILDITKIESGKLLLNRTKFDLNIIINDIIKDLTSSHKITMTNSNVKLIFNPKESFTVYADKERIYQVTNNLIQNAIKFSNTTSTKAIAKIDIILERVKQANNDNNNKGDEMISIKIRDNGKGIDSEILPKLFSKFTTKSEYGGTGIGLYISKKIIEAHGGTIRGYNNPDNGATFEFTLPFYQKS
jgi:signal transduction histidine kinase